jgi:hypothetical protein
VIVQPSLPQRDGSVTSLLADILGDVGTLVRKELELARVEIRSDLLSFKTPATLLLLGAALLAAGCIVTLVAAGVWIAWLRLWPQWAGYAIAALALLLLGAILLALALRRLRTANLYPERTAETLQESYQWLTNRSASTRPS